MSTVATAAQDQVQAAAAAAAAQAAAAADPAAEVVRLKAELDATTQKVSGLTKQNQEVLRRKGDFEALGYHSMDEALEALRKSKEMPAAPAPFGSLDNPDLTDPETGLLDTKKLVAWQKATRDAENTSVAVATERLTVQQQAESLAKEYGLTDETLQAALAGSVDGLTRRLTPGKAASSAEVGAAAAQFKTLVEAAVANRLAAIAATNKKNAASGPPNIPGAGAATSTQQKDLDQALANARPEDHMKIIRDFNRQRAADLLGSTS